MIAHRLEFGEANISLVRGRHSSRYILHKPPHSHEESRERSVEAVVRGVSDNFWPLCVLAVGLCDCQTKGDN